MNYTGVGFRFVGFSYASDRLRGKQAHARSEVIIDFLGLTGPLDSLAASLARLKTERRRIESAQRPCQMLSLELVREL